MWPFLGSVQCTWLRNKKLGSISGLIFSPSTFSPLLSSDCARTLTCSLAHCLSGCLFSYFFNNYLLKAKWTLLNNPWDKVKEIIQQYLPNIIEFSIIAYSRDFEFNCKSFVFVDCSMTIDHLAQGDHKVITILNQSEWTHLYNHHSNYTNKVNKYYDE